MKLSFHHPRRKKKRKKKKACEKDGENRIFDEVTPVATLRVLPIDKLEKVCTTADD